MKPSGAIERILISASLLLLAAGGPVASSHAQGHQYCPGDGTWAACPCGNANDGSASGCDWQGTSGLSGAALSATGSNDLLADDAFLTATNTSGNYGVFFGANNQSHGTLSDGLRCAGGGLVRLIPPSSTGSSTHVLPASLQSLDTGAMIGATRNYQYWFRTPGGPCGFDANTTNGYSITWTVADMAAIPAGTFEMGRHLGSGNGDERPVHAVYLDAFDIDVYEVSNQKYADHLNLAYAQGRVEVNPYGDVFQVGGTGKPLCATTTASSVSRITWDGSTFGVTAGKENHPMLQVTWYGACAYANGPSRDHGLTPCYDETTWDCNFSAGGYRLPTEAEWEYAGRGGEHDPYYMYPWDDDDENNGSMANYYLSGDEHESDPFPRTTPVGYYDGTQMPAGEDMANGYGLYDMSGNAWEWCWDWHDPSYYSSSPPNNPTGPATGSHRVFRGGSWFSGLQGLRLAYRHHNYPTSRFYYVGFRVLAVRSDT